MNIVRNPYTILGSALAAVVAISSAPLGLAGAAPSKKPPPEKSAVEKPPAVDPKAVDALRDMGTFLREQKSFSVSTKTDTDYVTDTGQKLTVSSEGEIDVQRPNRIHAEVKSDRKERQFFYDGKTFTIFSPKLGFYSTLAAPATIGELADQLQTRYGLELPMVDLFRWGEPDADFSEIKAAQYVGPSTIDGVAADHYSFRQPGVDWQIWIERGSKPIPHKMILTTTDTEARPQFEIGMKWKLAVEQSDATFTFVAPKDSNKIAMEDLGVPKAEIENAKPAKRSARQQNAKEVTP